MNPSTAHDLPVVPPSAPPFDRGLDAHTHAQSELQRALLAPAQEHESMLLTPSYGSVPVGLAGTLFSNGAGTRLRDRWIEGDGLVAAAHFEDGKVRHQSRFVRTPKYLASERFMAGDAAALRMASRGVFPGSEANTSVLRIGDRLLALWEGAPPYELDPESLETIGQSTCEGQLRTSSLLGADGFSAHPCWDAKLGEAWTYGVRYLPSPRLTVYRFDAAARLQRVREIQLPKRYLVHACALTPNYVVFSLGPAVLQMSPFSQRAPGIAGAFAWRPELPTRVLLVPRDGSPETVFEAEPFFQWHFAGASEQKGDVFFDLVRFPSWSAMQQVIGTFSAPPDVITYGTLWRYRVQRSGPRAGTVDGYPLSSVPLEFPTVDPRRQTGGYRYVYGAAVRSTESGSSFTSVAKYDTWTGNVDDFDFGPGHNVGEPLLAPREPNKLERDDAGWLLAYHNDLTRHVHELVIFDAQRVSDGPVCRLPVPSVGSRFHGQWVPLGSSGYGRVGAGLGTHS